MRGYIGAGKYLNTEHRYWTRKIRKIRVLPHSAHGISDISRSSYTPTGAVPGAIIFTMYYSLPGTGTRTRIAIKGDRELLRVR